MPKEASKKPNNKKQNDKKLNDKNKKHFMKDFKAELKRVIWPTPKQLVNNTVAVITVVLITAAIVFVLDFVFESMNTYGINKLKEIVDTNSEVTNITDVNQVDDSTTSNETVNETTDESANQTENAEAEDANSVEE